jgi:Fe-S-cluster-containing dehydrogenase component
MKPYALIINYELCWGCRTCEVACKQENGAADGIRLISVWQDGPRIMDGKLDVVFRVGVCQHCDDPACVDACPEEAITRREDGIVVLDDQQCSGCRLCVDACPYDAIAFDDFNGVARKCNLCHHRVDRGLVPACADNVCPAHCIYFGDPGESPWGLSK